MTLITAHVKQCQWKALGHSDAAKRVSDTINLHWAVNHWDCVGKWVAFALQDGTGGMDLFPSKRDAVRLQSDELRCMYLRIVPGGMGICEAEILLRVHRQLHTNGYRLADPDSKNGGKSFIPRVDARHMNETLRLLGGKVTPN